MFDTMTLTKTAAGILGALLLFLLGSWAATSLYSIGYHDEDHVAGYVIDTGEGEAAEPEEEVIEVAFADVYAAADPAAGEGLFRACQACHALEQGDNGIGPYLYGVVDRQIAAVDGFEYSDALAGLDQAWTPENISGFIEAPRDWAPGTAMGYNGMDDIEDRANLIAYLATFGG